MRWPFFKRKADTASALQRERVAGLVRDALQLGSDPAITVSEIDCSDLACPGIETIILILIDGSPTRALKITKPMIDVIEEDVRTALSNS